MFLGFGALTWVRHKSRDRLRSFFDQADPLSAQSAGRLRSIDFLRGLAALAVVASHAITYGPLASASSPSSVWFRVLFAVTSRGYLGVPLFFVISGFCIHAPWAKRLSENGDTSIRFGQFWKRRIHRLYPPYFVALVASMSLVLIAYVLHKEVPLLTSYPNPTARWMGIDFLSHALMLHGFSPTLDRMGGNPPFWTLAREEYLYILYFVLLFWRRSGGVIHSVIFEYIAGLIFLVFCKILLPADSRFWPLVYSSALALWVQWALGMLAVENHFGLTRLPSFFSSLWFVPAWGVIATAADSHLPLLAPLLWGLTFFTLVNFCVKQERLSGWPFGASTPKPVAWLTSVGLFSYSIYLVHNPTRGVVKQLLGTACQTQNPWLYVTCALLMAAAGYWVGKLFFILVERRFLNTVPLTKQAQAR